MKKLLSACLSFVILLSAATGTACVANAKTSHTPAEAVAWATSKEGYQVGSGECVALIKAYYEYLGVASVRGNGCDYAWNARPDDWQRIPYYPGFVAQPGDIAVWTYLSSSYGHVAIVISADANSMNVVDQGKTYNYKCHRGNFSYTKGTFYGVIRPDFDSEPPVISNVQITSKNKKGYKITCTATDNASVSSVKFETYNSTGLVDSGYGTSNNSVWSYTFSKAVLSGSYYTKITAVDTSNNTASTKTKNANVKCQAATPTFSVSNVSGGKKISINCATPKANIYYKADNGKYKKYTGAFKLTASKKISAYAEKSNYYKSSTCAKQVNIVKVSAPTISTKGSIGGKTVSLKSKTANAVIYYKTSKNADYKKYTKPFKIGATKTIYTYAKKAGYKNSATTKKSIKISTTAKPKGVQATAKSSSSVKVSWKQVKGASGYYIYQSVKKSGKYKKVATVKGGSSTAKTISSLSQNKTYYFKVRAYTNGKKTSAYSSAAGAKTKKYTVPDSKLKGEWKILSNALSGDGSDSYTFTFDGKGNVKIHVTGYKKDKSKKVKYKKNGNTVTFSAYGISYKVVYKANSKVLGFQQSGKAAVDTYASILVKSSTKLYGEQSAFNSTDEFKSVVQYFNHTQWNSKFLANKYPKYNPVLFVLSYHASNWGNYYNLEYRSGSPYTQGGYEGLCVVNDNLFIADFYDGDRKILVFLEKRSSNQINAFVNNNGKLVMDTWTKNKS